VTNRSSRPSASAPCRTWSAWRVAAGFFVAGFFVAGIFIAAPTAARAQGVTLDQYRAAETTRDGFVVTRPVGLGHLGVSASLHVDYGLEPLRGPASRAGGTLVDHQLTGQLGVALGVLDRLVVALRVPVVLLLSGRSGTAGDPATRDPIASGRGAGRRRALAPRGAARRRALRRGPPGRGRACPPRRRSCPAQDLAGEAGRVVHARARGGAAALARANHRQPRRALPAGRRVPDAPGRARAHVGDGRGASTSCPTCSTRRSRATARRRSRASRPRRSRRWSSCSVCA
jgi:hypothetical protein